VYGGAEIRSQRTVSIGEHAGIGHHAILGGRGELSVGQNVASGTGVLVWAMQHDPQSPEFATASAREVVEDYPWIRCRAVILPGAHIGRGAAVAAGAVVAGDARPFAIVAGVPAGVVGRRTENLRYRLEWCQPVH
jgi:maltose O-acetyltransferase